MPSFTGLPAGSSPATRRAQKRGGQFEITSLDGNAIDPPNPGADDRELGRISDALDALADMEPELAQVVDLMTCSSLFSLSKAAGAKVIDWRGPMQVSVHEPASAMKRQQWESGSPLLDQALEMASDDRAAWLASLHLADPALAADLELLLAEANSLAEERFLEDDAPLRPPVAALVGQTFGSYTVVAPIGQGGMGTVWLARRSDGRFEGEAAVKLLNASLLGHAGEERFRREGNILARLTHPHIAHLIDAGMSASGPPYLLLEYVEGEPIDRHCDALGLGVEERLRLFLDVLDAVALAHANLVVHRDIKPSNVLVSKDGQVKLLDFGIAKLLEGEAVDGAPTALTRDAGRAFTPTPRLGDRARRRRRALPRAPADPRAARHGRLPRREVRAPPSRSGRPRGGGVSGARRGAGWNRHPGAPAGRDRPGAARLRAAPALAVRSDQRPELLLAVGRRTRRQAIHGGRALGAGREDRRTAAAPDGRGPRRDADLDRPPVPEPGRRRQGAPPAQQGVRVVAPEPGSIDARSRCLRLRERGCRSRRARSRRGALRARPGSAAEGLPVRARQGLLPPARRLGGAVRRGPGAIGGVGRTGRGGADDLATGIPFGDGHADLAIGAPYENENGLADVGAEMVLYGSLFSDGFDSGAADLWSVVLP